jgi:hypothetical protein
MAMADVAYLKAIDAWRIRRDPRPLSTWLARNLDPDGVPRRLPVTQWWPLLEMIDAVAPDEDDEAFEPIEAQIEGFLHAALRFSRPDGSAVFSDEHRPSGRGRLLARLAGRLADTQVETIARWWFPTLFRPRRAPSSPLLPAFSASEATGPLAILRADWLARGDFLAIDQRAQPTSGLLELVGGGTRWLGPAWDRGQDAGRSRLTFWSSTPSADCAEWTFRRGAAKVTRFAVFFRSRKLALVSEQVDGGAANLPTLRLQTAPGVEVKTARGRREARLTSGRSSCVVVPIGLPEGSFPTAHGSFRIDGRDLVLNQRAEPRRSWLPLLVNWDAGRNRLPVQWRRLTVSENSKVCKPGTAIAFRVWWGTQKESLLIYRSLGPPALRAFLGHQTRSRIVIGRFDHEGNVEPFLKVD